MKKITTTPPIQQQQPQQLERSGPIGCCRPRMLEACAEEDEDDNHHRRKTSRESSTIEFVDGAAAGGARPSLGGVSIGAISSGDTSVLINTDEMNDSADWSPEIPFENVKIHPFG